MAWLGHTFVPQIDQGQCLLLKPQVRAIVSLGRAGRLQLCTLESGARAAPPCSWHSRPPSAVVGSVSPPHEVHHTQAMWEGDPWDSVASGADTDKLVYCSCQRLGVQGHMPAP